jgi:hypothetical protein
MRWRIYFGRVPRRLSYSAKADSGAVVGGGDVLQVLDRIREQDPEPAIDYGAEVIQRDREAVAAYMRVV